MKENWTKITVKGREKWFIDFGRYEVLIYGKAGEWTAVIDDVAHGESSRVSCAVFSLWEEAEAWVLEELFAMNLGTKLMADRITGRLNPFKVEEEASR